jgi:hypothetical protein
MSITGSRIGGRGAVAGKHLPGPPARDAHQVNLGSAGAEPLMREGVAEHVGMEVRDAGLPGASVEQVPQPGDGERPTLAEP